MNMDVIIVGDDHVNTLGTIRAFGENNIKPYLYVISTTKLVAIGKSKYLKKCTICRDEEMAIQYILNDFKKKSPKPLLIATSDKAVSIIDTNYNILKEQFILSNINDDKKNIIKYMNKFEQYLLFKKYNLSVAESQILTYPFEENKQIAFPLIIKPLLSIYGEKKDICIVKNDFEYNQAINFFKDNKYFLLLIQEYLSYDYECDITGYSYKGNSCISGYVKKLRIFPVNKGSTTFGIMNNISNMTEEIKKIKRLFYSLNYTGIFNIEFFIKDNKFIMNEINFRNSAIGYSYLNANPNYYFYLSCKSKKLINSKLSNDSYYIINELSDLHNVLEKNITIKEYFKNKKMSKVFLIYSKNDIKPSLYMYFYKFLNMLKVYKMLTFVEKIYHSREDTYVLCANNNAVINKKYNNDYKVVIIDETNTNMLYENKNFIKKFIIGYKKGNQKALALIDKNNEFIGKAILKSKGAQDDWVKIKNNNSYLISSVYINPIFRGKKYQRDLINELINKFISSKEYKIYGIVYTYNTPSCKNFEKMGFKIIQNKTFKLKRLLKKSLNKITV